MSKIPKTLIKIASAPLSEPLGKIDSGPLIEQLVDTFLSKKNGFFAYERALLVRPLSSTDSPLGIVEWNEPDLWKEKYEGDLSEHIFFAENVFGEQYSLTSEGVYSFDSELGEITLIAENLSAWVALILEDTDFITGHSLAKKWQSKNGALSSGERLIPKQSFVLKGEFNIENLIVKPDVEAMKIRAEFANKIANLPDGAEIQFKVTD